MGQCYNNIEIPKPTSLVWRTINHFHDLSWAPNVVSSVSKIGEIDEFSIGAKRILNNAFHETLTKLDPVNYTFSYSIDDGPGPIAKDQVTNYIGIVQLTDLGEVCLVEWLSNFESDDDNAVADFCNPIYQALLNDLKNTLTI